MWNKIRVLRNTIVYLKPIQIYFQIYYRLKSTFWIKRKYSNSYYKVSELKWEDGIYNLRTFFGEKSFKFINLKLHFGKEIDWNYTDFELLWNYNLNYFDYLNRIEHQIMNFRARAVSRPHLVQEKAVGFFLQRHVTAQLKNTRI